MDKGGNENLYEYLQKYDLNSSDHIAKYTSKAAQYYRKLLSAKASNDESGIQALETQGAPAYEEGRLPSDSPT
jgi:hypothetical protein